MDRLTLSEEEIDAFSEQRWLLDQNIEFWLEHVVHDLFESDGVSFLSPSAVQMAHLFGPGSSDLAEAIFNVREELAAPLVLLPVNDNESDAAGGSHWSLLVFHRPSASFRHLDSMGGSNTATARRIAAALAPLVGAPDAGFEEEQDVPQQSNGFDCGVHVMVMAEIVARHCKDALGPWTRVPCSAWAALSPDAVRATRVEAARLARAA
ncbi:hypothetical protein T484DRAFT_1973457 [Baffinella frigidus]|nr:hypothetical protein T484DRAFT_1973457 [Cryptophyta sp. CCMP2293]|mmetsp:Transcript_67461/g.161004  ORF Transcript_67461/g.161004 Transcript_67461/m.161004 type:complete len:208 (-) Transcript_67461:89-712(-)